jgi:NAD(P)-dependent dehydrogenase (short-subunit alcohol dehydrogenase family)
VLFIHCDTTKYSDQLALFKTAFKKWGHIDIVVANAGISLPQDPFLPGQDIEKEFSTAEMYPPLFPSPPLPSLSHIQNANLTNVPQRRESQRAVNNLPHRASFFDEEWRRFDPREQHSRLERMHRSRGVHGE